MRQGERRRNEVDEAQDYSQITCLFFDSKGNDYATLDDNKVVRMQRQEMTVCIGFPGKVFIGARYHTSKTAQCLAYQILDVISAAGMY